MKYQKILGLVATAGLLLAGCATDSDNSNTWLSDPNAVHVSASVGSIFTRSNPTDEAKQTSFNKGDVMGVSNSGKSINYTFDGTNWQPGSGTDAGGSAGTNQRSHDHADLLLPVFKR